MNFGHFLSSDGFPFSSFFLSFFFFFFFGCENPNAQRASRGLVHRKTHMEPWKQVVTLRFLWIPLRIFGHVVEVTGRSKFLKSEISFYFYHTFQPKNVTREKLTLPHPNYTEDVED